MMFVTKMFFSLVIGMIGITVAKYVHPDWTLNHVFIFGLIVFGITLILAMVIK